MLSVDFNEVKKLLFEEGVDRYTDFSKKVRGKMKRLRGYWMSIEIWA